MNKWLYLSVFALTFSALASDLDKRPPAFATARSQAVFADFTNAYYEITYDLAAKASTVVAHIDLVTAEDGQVIFDSLQEPTKVLIDGEETGAELIATPGKETVIRVVKKDVPAGMHHLQVNVPMGKEMIEFTESGVKNAFWMSDLNDRGYIEKYLPTNFIFDLVPMTLKLKFVGGLAKQSIYTNGNVTKISDSEYKVVFRKNLNVTCPYFHTVPEGTFAEKAFSVRSVDGRELPALIYVPEAESSRLPGLQAKVISLIEELENDYGAFLHSSILVYVNAPSGGMEYSGATVTSESALGHELFHSYFARGVMPADGNSGWIDEALASWRDKGYSSITSLEGSSKMANLGTYTRLTDRAAYSFGERFMSLLNNKFSEKGGLKPFLRALIERRAFDPIHVQDLINEMNSFYGTDVTPLFTKYLMGHPATPAAGQKAVGFPSFGHGKFHHQFTQEELRNLL